MIFGARLGARPRRSLDYGKAEQQRIAAKSAVSYEVYLRDRTLAGRAKYLQRDVPGQHKQKRRRERNPAPEKSQRGNACAPIVAEALPQIVDVDGGKAAAMNFRESFTFREARQRSGMKVGEVR